jgi:hypothetical protein
MAELRIGYATYKAVKFACENWHYSKCVPHGGRISYGVWEDGVFIGAVLYGVSARPNYERQFGVKKNEILELTRVALRGHKTPVSRIIAVTLKMLRKKEPQLKIIISYADSGKGHHGGIYQAGGWIYLYRSEGARRFVINGRSTHSNQISRKLNSLGLRSTLENVRKYYDPKAEIIQDGAKHLYVLCFDKETDKRMRSVANPYPKRVASSCVGSAESGTAPDHGARGGASPTATLQEGGNG